MAKATTEVVNPGSGEITELEEFALDRGEETRVLTFAEAIAEAESHGVTEANITVIVNPYETVNKDKHVLVDRPLMVRAVKFATDRDTGNEYAHFFIIRDDNALFRVTDGSTGMYSQIREQVQARLDSGHKTPYNYFLFPNGLEESEFGIDENGKAVPLGSEFAVAKGATYYFK